MKKNIFVIALLLGLQFSLTASAQQASKVTLRVPNFARQLVEKWVTEYQKTLVNDNTGVDFQFVAGKTQDNDNTISLTTDDDAVLVARYAVLPITTKGSEAEKLLGSHALNAKKLKQIFFVEDELNDDQKENKLERSLHIVTGNSLLSASRLYAANFHKEIVDYKGKKVSGDDSYLNLAISRDPLSVTVNYLSNIFDLESRQLHQALALLPLDIDKQGRQVLNDGRLDAILQLLEDEQYTVIPVGRIGFKYNHANAVLNDFVQWVLNFGTEYVHEYGLLQLPRKELAVQLRRTVQKDLAQK